MQLRHTLSLRSIKRAENGEKVSLRTARNLAICLGVPVHELHVDDPFDKKTEIPHGSLVFTINLDVLSCRGDVNSDAILSCCYELVRLINENETGGCKVYSFKNIKE